MNLDNKTQALTETSIITAIMVVFALVGIYFNNIIIFLYPIPFIVLGVRHGTRYNILSLAMSSLVLGMLTNIILGIILFVFFGFVSVTLSYMLKRKYSTSKILMVTTGILIIAILVTLSLFNVITGTSLISGYENLSDEAINLVYDRLKEMGFLIDSPEEADEIIKAGYEYFILIIPFMIFTSSLFIVYINFWLSTATLRRLGNRTIEVPRLKRFRLPSNIILGSIVIILCTFLIRYFEGLYHETILLNVIALLSFVFFLQGLAVLVFFVDKMRIIKIFKWMIIFFVIINVFLFIPVAFTGFLDVLLDFRKIRKVNMP